MRANRFNIKGALGSLLILLFFCSVPVILLYQNLNSSIGAQPLKNRIVDVDPPTATYYGSPALVYSPALSDLCITFGFLTLDPATSLANFAILVGATKQGNQELRQLGKHGYSSVLLVVNSNVGLGRIKISVPFSTLESSKASKCGGSNLSGDRLARDRFRKELLRYAGFRTNQDIFLLGQPRAFPNDWYELNDSVSAYATDGSPEGAAIRNTQHVKLPSSLIIMTRNEDLPMRVSLDGSSEALAMKHPLIFTISRPRRIVFYTYWVASLPFMLLLAIGIYQYTYKKSIPKPYEVAFGVAATMVAILPLRAVLVPSSLPNLTRLDIVFSTEVALLVALSIAWVITLPSTSAETETADKAASATPTPASHDGGRPSDGNGEGA